MSSKVIFDGPNKRIIVQTGVTTLELPKDVYSEWKKWVLTGFNSKFLEAFRTVGGDPINESEGIYVASYFFLQNGWRIKPQEANHTLNVTKGILLVEGGGDPFVNTTGPYVVRINYQQPVQAITVATSSGGGSAYSLPCLHLDVYPACLSDTGTVQLNILVQNGEEPFDYEIDWGDSSPVERYSDQGSFLVKTHNYSDLGGYEIKVTVTDYNNNSCSQKIYICSDYKAIEGYSSVISITADKTWSIVRDITSFRATEWMYYKIYQRSVGGREVVVIPLTQAQEYYKRDRRYAVAHVKLNQAGEYYLLLARGRTKLSAVQYELSRLIVTE